MFEQKTTGAPIARLHIVSRVWLLDRPVPSEMLAHQMGTTIG